jgi:Protein of unknown function (DUF1549)
MLVKPAMISCCLGFSALVPAVMGAGEPRQTCGFTAEERGRWSFQPLKKVTPPAVDESKATVRNDIDRFIVARFPEPGLEQAPEASGRERVRRLYCNLHGLLPTEEQVLAHLIGTAFLRHGIYGWNQADAGSQRDLIVKELAGLTGEAFLGLNIGCAECHDHKFNPILHAAIMHLLGVDRTKMIYQDKGRPERIDQNEGHVYEGILT